MKWIRRLLWPIKGALLIICLAIVVLWVRSYWRKDGLRYVTGLEQDRGPSMRWLWTRSERGWVWLDSIHFSFPGESAVEVKKFLSENPQWSLGWHQETAMADVEVLKACASDSGWGPVRWHVGQASPMPLTAEFHYLRIPHWFATLMVGAWPVVSMALVIRRARERRR